MINAAPSRRDLGICLAAALTFGTFVYLMLPAEVTTLGDDFGYYKSIVETIQHGRPWTDGWLEPWAASLSGLSALIFLATGSFHAATYGLQAFLAAAGGGAAVLLFRERGHTVQGSALAALLVFTFPTFLWKLLEFTGIVLYWPCLLFALLAAEKRRWGWFFVCWGLAVATRQSALAWLIIPGWEIAANWVAGRRRREDWQAPALAAGAGLALFALLAAGMNKSHAQTVITDQMMEGFEPQRCVRFAATGLLVFGAAAGCGAFLLRLGGKLAPVTRPRIILAAGLILLTAGVLQAYEVRDLVVFEHASLRGPAGWSFVLGLLAAAMAGWAGGGFHLKPRLAVYALASLALVSLRADLWDYYLGDIVLFGLLGVAAPAPEPGRTARRVFLVAGSLLVAGTLAFNLWVALQFKLRLDRTYATNALVEQAFRDGRVAPHQLYGTSFGYIAWHLQPYFEAHEGRTDPKIARFWNYLLYSLDVRTQYLGWLGTIEPFKSEFPPEPAKLIRTEVRPVWWVFRARFTLERATPVPNPPPHIPMRLEEYRRIPFPLNDAEWRDLVARERM